jgi:hypothetical protein
LLDCISIAYNQSPKINLKYVEFLVGNFCKVFCEKVCYILKKRERDNMYFERWKDTLVGHIKPAGMPNVIHMPLV